MPAKYVRPYSKGQKNDFRDRDDPEHFAWGELVPTEPGTDRIPAYVWTGQEDLPGMCAVVGEEITAEFVAAHPGRRPRWWWKENAPEPRQRLGGVGMPWEQAARRSPVALERGVPTHWLYEGGAWDGVPIDPANPPLYESEAAYLRRHHLLTREELQQLTEADFAPVAINGTRRVKGREPPGCARRRGFLISLGRRRWLSPRQGAFASLGGPPETACPAGFSRARN
jgi:hypothetical protein